MTIVDGSAEGLAVAGPAAITIAIFLAIAMYNVLELSFIIITTFKKRNGLYFWSFIIASWGIAVHEIGFLLQEFNITTNSYLYVTLMLLGWYAMVTGQSVVLYSRLHLVLYNENWLRAVLVMIVTNAIVFHIPQSVLTYGVFSNNPDPFLSAFSIYEKIQITIFFLQELVISGLYIHTTATFLRIRGIVARNMNYNTMKHLLFVNLLVIILDVTILTLEFSNLHNIQTVYKGFAYSLKLKLEFSILNRLVDVAQARHDPSSAILLESIDSRNKDAQRSMDKMNLKYGAHVHTGGAGDLAVAHDLGNANDSVLRTRETTEGRSIQWQRATSGARSEMTGKSSIAAAEGDAVQDSRSSSQTEFVDAGF